MIYNPYQVFKEQLRFHSADQLSQKKQSALELFIIQRNIISNKLNDENKYIQNNIDIEVLQNIHANIFENMSEVGFLDYNEGFFREPTDLNDDHVKQRRVTLNKTEIDYYVCYSRMRNSDIEELAKTLQQINLSKLAKLSKQELAKEISTLYGKLNYIHPFQEGNSRTIRTFIGLLAKKLNFQINWDLIDRNDFYIARDILVSKQAVNTIADQDLKMQIESFNQGVVKLGLESQFSLTKLISKALEPIQKLQTKTGLKR